MSLSLLIKTIITIIIIITFIFYSHDTIVSSQIHSETLVKENIT